MSGDGVIEAARELLRARNHAGVVAVASGVIDEDPHNVEMRLLRARALVALRRDREAQIDLRECLRRQVRCAPAYRMLGEVCFRRDEHDSAAVFLREALRLDPWDQDARDLLALASRFIVQPTAAVEKLPAATAAVGPSPFPTEPRRARNRPPRLARGTCGPRHEDLDDMISEELWADMDSVTEADPPDPALPLDSL